jgi:hypothetical protein
VTFNEIVEGVGKTIDGAGVAAIVVGALVATGIAATRARAREPDVYRRYRLEITGRWPWQKPDLPPPGD